MAYATVQEALLLGKGEERQIHCPNPAHNDQHASASLNAFKRVWFCYSCGAKGRVEGEMSQDELVQMVSTIFDERVEVAYSEAWWDLYEDPDNSYWLSRYDPETVEFFELGEYEGNPAFPMRDRYGVIRGIVQRSDGAGAKYKYPYDFQKSHTLFGYSLVHSDVPVITEGATDAMAAWEVGFPAWAIYGSVMSKEQADLISATHPRYVVLAFDRDTAGWRASALVTKMMGARGIQCVDALWLQEYGSDLSKLNKTFRHEVLSEVVLLHSDN